MIERFKSWGEELMATIHPARCVACGAASLGLFCQGCEGELAAPAATGCVCCMASGVVHGENKCPRCVGQAPPYAQLRACWRYEGPAALALRQLKYAEAQWVARGLAQLATPGLEHRVAELGLTAEETVVLTPVPAHPRGLRRRGYHPASMLGRELEQAWRRRRASARYPMPALVAREGLLRRTRWCPPQASQADEAAREANVRGSFEVVKSASGRVVVFDDVVTTGSTVAEAVRAWQRAGRAEVEVWALARA
jgi:competence protein ComFC